MTAQLNGEIYFTLSPELLGRQLLGRQQVEFMFVDLLLKRLYPHSLHLLSGYVAGPT